MLAGKPSVLIVGAGIIGISTAYYLMKSERCGGITLIEEGEPAGGASGYAAGFLAKNWHGAPTASLGRLSYELHSQLAEELNGENRFGYRKVSSLSMQVEKGRGQTSESSKNDLLKAWLDGKNVTKIEVIDDQGTAQVHPQLFCHTLLEECQKNGVCLIKGRANSVKKTEKGQLQVNLDDGQNVIVEKLAFCTGPWTGKVLKEMLNVDIPIYELAGHSIVLKTSKPLPPLALFATVLDKDDKSTITPELFSRPDGTIYIAGENSGAPLPPGTAHVQKSQDSIDRLLSACKLISPLLDLHNAEIVKEQLCYRPISRRGYPYLCKLSSSLFFTAGHGPWGISLGPGTGKVMSEMILDGHAISADISDLEKMGKSSDKGQYGILDIIEQRLGVITDSHT